MAGKKRKEKPAPPQHRVALDADDSVVSKKRARPPKHHQSGDELISSDLSSKILKEAINQQKEILQEAEEENRTPFSAVSVDPSVASDSDAEDAGAFDDFSETQSQYDVDEVEIDEEDEKLLAAFMSTKTGPQPTLADIIIQRIKEKEAEVTSERPLPKLDSNIIDLYRGVGKLLSRYTNGKIPKAFKHIPAIELWEDVLYLTEPENWSPNAMFQATKIFSSNLSVKKAQRFYTLVLLPQVREDIRKNKRLHFALYQALKKSLYKPAAFFKGVLLPLCQSGTCTLREAVIIGSIIQKVSIPPLHSSAALMKLAELEYCGTTSYFIKLFLDKKYALPYRVLDAVVAHFMRFLEDTRIMPVIWHQSLLAFVQRYKNELNKEQKDDLHRLIQYQKHHLVTPEIRRELKNSRNRGEEDDPLRAPFSVINKPIEEDRWDFPEEPPNLFFSRDDTVSASKNAGVSKPTSIRAANSVSSVGKSTRVSKTFQGKPKFAAISISPRKSRIGAGLAADAERVRIREELRRETEETLEWGSVCSQVSAFVSTSVGRALCRSGNLPVGRDREESEKLLDQTAAAVLLPRPLDFSGIDDVSEIVRAAVAGELLGIRELCAIERSLQSARRVFEQLEQISADESSDRYTSLLEILQDCDFLVELANQIAFCIDGKLSIVLDQASMKLESIRMERRKNMEKLESFLKEVSMKVFQSGGIDSPLVTKRRSRMCVGIKASHKSLLPEGIVLSSSSSGATYFIEPRDAIELNNMEVRLFNDEKAEELAILGVLTSEIAHAETKIRYLMENILELDLAVARGAYALWNGGVRPYLIQDYERFKSIITGDTLSVDIESIQHPLLLEPSLRHLPSVSEKGGGSSILFDRRNLSIDSEEFLEVEPPVPVDFKIENSTKVVVISGPNTGGKTATMKTLGLASIMSKAGMFLSARDQPKLPWFDQILADIGDHQSLEHNLSTFSGHISRICKITEVASENSLVLIDEIGSGTDPSEGVALSTSILRYLADHANLSVVTTHYADLSRLKSGDSRFENAAMEFCLETLQPTFRILWGSTGNSNALSIAKSIGFDQKMLDRAEEWVKKLEPDRERERQGSLYQSLLEERNLLEAQANEAALVLEEVKKLHSEIQSEAEDIDKRVAALKAKESHLVQQELKIVKSKMDSIIQDFESRIQSATLDQFSLIMRESETAIASIVAAHSPKDDMSYERTESGSSYLPQIGDQVYVTGLGDKVATVVAAPAEDGTTTVQYGKIKVRVKRNDMRLVQSSSGRHNSALRPRGQIRRWNKGPATEANKDEEAAFGPAVRTSKNTVDLRGKRVEEASHRLQMAILGCKSRGVLFIVHGTGTGAVKECVLEVLRNHPRVAKFEEESPMNYGCTVAYIK
ncbi:unnamed protein product [Musa banksii]